MDRTPPCVRRGETPYGELEPASEPRPAALETSVMEGAQSAIKKANRQVNYKTKFGMRCIGTEVASTARDGKDKRPEFAGGKQHQYF
jgi:hypothetical protein